MDDKKKKMDAVPQKSQVKALPHNNNKAIQTLNEVLRRLRIMEERYSNLRKKNQLTDQNMLDDTKRLSDDINVIKSIVSDIKREIDEVNLKMRQLSEEIGMTVPRRDVELLNKYLDYWEPMGFMKRDEAEGMIREIIDRIKNEV